MSKTLTLKKTIAENVDGPDVIGPPALLPKAYTADELRAMLAAMGEPEKPARVITDPTMDLSIDLLPAHEIADKSKLPPVGERSDSAIQVPANVHGRFGLNGIPLIAPGVDLSQSINPATGAPYAQVGTRLASQIQVPPQSFGRRLPR